MTEDEILNEICGKEYLNEERTIFSRFISPEKLAAFLAKHLKE